ncbi:MAG: dehydrogenase [Pseudomonadota bacterium]|jgi:2,4-dienoyl-CoA reductase-like NADH-dependent reductase (Old Yellow Enzyme family)
MAALFTPFALRGVTLRNRIGIAPMCQYQSRDGFVDDWQLVHLGARAIGGAGVVIAEATAVSPEGRISPGCAGLWQDAHIEPWRRAARFIKAQGAVPGIQLAHAGRKGSAHIPWVEGGAHLPEGHADAWDIVAPSAIAFGGNLGRVPRELGVADIARVQADFVAAARRALAAGFEWLELHFAHGYLAQSFFSPIANQRSDAYGGSFEGRARFLLETAEQVRAAWPDHLPLGVKLGVTDFDPRGHSIEESIALLSLLGARGIDLVDVSLGFNTPDVSAIPWGPGFLVPVAARIRAATGLPVAAGWMISEPAQAEAIIASGQADLVVLARASLADPQWPYHAAVALGVPDAWQTLPRQTGGALQPRGR